jgi:PPK2 family polyphosphate:nucleotide phosphotransferase
MKTYCDATRFRVPYAGKKSAAVDLAELPTTVPALYRSKKEYRAQLEDFTSSLVALQEVLYAHGRYAVLLVLQGMDTAGKDGAIRHVMSGVNPQGCSVHSFKQPSAEELAHDFLWRTTLRLPRRGHIGIFNRSYYEEVLIVKADPAVLARQPLPEACVGHKHFWADRYRDIVAFEDYLHRNGTVVLKFFLHLSKEEQCRRLLARAKDETKHWKVSPADLESHDRWDDLARAYAECLAATSHPAAPWFAVPADDKRNARLIISQIVVDALEALPLRYPEVTDRQREAVAEIKRRFGKAGKG